MLYAFVNSIRCNLSFKHMQNSAKSSEFGIHCDLHILVDFMVLTPIMSQRHCYSIFKKENVLKRKINDIK